jgi:hypothetical protein
MAAAIEIDTLQGTLDDAVWFHLDLSNDVLYFRLQETRQEPVFGEETPEGITLLRTEEGHVAGMTIVHYWRRFGSGDLSSASIHAIKERVAAWAQDHSLAA